MEFLADTSRRLRAGLSALHGLARAHPIAAGFVLAAVLVRVVFWAYTGRLWEDALITVTHSHNAAQGLGLTHHASEPRVHGFTSAISVLVPLLGEVLGANPFHTLRLASLVAAVVTVLYAYGVARDLELKPAPTCFLLSYLSFDQLQIFYGMAGMETQMAVAILFGGLFHLQRMNPLRCGVFAGLAFMARPDFIFWVGPAGVCMLVRDRKAFGRALGAMVAVGLPWLVFTLVYYGTPVPNTIVAKNQLHGMGLAASPSLEQLWTYAQSCWTLFAPIYESPYLLQAPLVPALYGGIAFAFIALACTGIVAGRRRAALLAASAFVVGFFAFRMRARIHNYAAWHVVPPLSVFALLAAVGLNALRARSRGLGVGVSALLAVAFAAHIPVSFPVEREMQRIEDSLRRPLGLYLNEVVAEDERIGLEPLGYFGYYSQRTIHDWPGLGSKVSVRTMGGLDPDKRRLSDLLAALEPEWLVLRDYEVYDLSRQHPETAVKYRVNRTFEVSEQPVKIHSLGAMYWFDWRFHVLRRIDLSEPGN